MSLAVPKLTVDAVVFVFQAYWQRVAHLLVEDEPESSTVTSPDCEVCSAVTVVVTGNLCVTEWYATPLLEGG